MFIFAYLSENWLMKKKKPRQNQNLKALVEIVGADEEDERSGWSQAGIRDRLCSMTGESSSFYFSSIKSTRMCDPGSACCWTGAADIFPISHRWMLLCPEGGGGEKHQCIVAQPPAWRGDDRQERRDPFFILRTASLSAMRNAL